MTIETSNYTVPVLPTVKFIDVDKKDVHDSWRLFFQQLISYLQSTISNEGTQSPVQPTTTITALNTAQSIGKYIYDGDLHKPMVNVNGTFREISVI